MIHLRHHTTAYAAPEIQVPKDIVWLKRATRLCALILAGLLLYVALRSLILAPWFAIQTLHLRGDSQFHNSLTIRANVLQQLTGNYFTLSLRRVQSAFEALPWIRSAVVQRVFPNQLVVQLTAHKPAARWISSPAPAIASTLGSTPALSGASKSPAAEDDDGDNDNEIRIANGLERLVNQQGELFDASGDAFALNELPILSGPDQRASELLTTYKALEALLAAQDLKILRLVIDPLQGWHAKLDGQASLVLGSGTGTEILAKAQRWLAHWPELKRHYERPLQSVDLRYQQGFSVRLAGVTTGMKAK
jgi:cell division protein FtsQ